ncbi:MAG: inositol monophosphatase [Akkermansia sp.]|nr:inositol monophosphatase [Akkermansia sp.]
MSTYSLQLRAAEQAARCAGRFLLHHFRSPLPVDEALAHDIKLRLDKETQQLIEAELSLHFPDYAVLGEEGRTESESQPEWIIDPIDGTVNYFYGLPLFCVSIALRVQGKVVLGCVYNPMLDECYCALADGVATCNGREIHVSSRSRMEEAIVFVGHGTHDGSGTTGLRRFAHISSQVRKIRILGTAALTLCYIADGRFDAYIENRINVWDFAAAGLILERAGGRVLFTPADETAEKGSILAWNGNLPLQQALILPSES